MKALNNNAHPLESLLKQHCPNGVEYKPLYELTFWDKKFAAVDKAWQPKTLKFTHILAKDLQNLIVPNGDIKLLSTGKFDDYTDIKTAQNLINEGEVLAIPSGGEANLKYYKGKFVDSGNILATARDNTNSLKFIYYYLLTRQKDLDSSFRGGSIKHPEMKKILQIPIPIPPLEIQQKIVEILDAFTELQAELQAELHARRKQYEYYRNKLLSFEELEKRANAIGGGLKLVSLGEVCETLPKGTLKTSQLTANGYPVINSGRDLYGYYSKFNNESNAFTIAARGEYAGFVNFMDSKFWAGGLCYPYRSNDENKLLTKFIYYHLKTNESNIMDSLVARGSIPAINKKDIDKKLKIPLPPLKVQNDIVEILDKFDTLANDLSTGLPAEIDARQKQYEHYREQLLSFREKCE